ncbi:hypothetical protein THIARS_40045 [Thiomonas delicata]|uniref:Uncharacterized protein n=1 Tax=Thiomonas delicata TaxID=364030 RepID=A0A238CZJ8_THIDL|nr:hypothetical protein THIARS_40045 [Thiomonas delicata]
MRVLIFIEPCTFGYGRIQSCRSGAGSFVRSAQTGHAPIVSVLFDLAQRNWGATVAAAPRHACCALLRRARRGRVWAAIVKGATGFRRFSAFS